MSDAVIEAGREFGEPILDPLTTDTKYLTQLINDNKDTWRTWGEDVAGIIRATKLVIDKIPSAPEKPDPDSWRTKINKTFDYNLTDYFPNDGSTHSLYDYFVEYGKRDIKKEQVEKAITAPTLGFDNINRSSIDTFLDPKTNTLIFESEKEKNARLKALEEKRLRDLEKSKAQKLVLLKNTADEAMAILKNRYDQQQAVIDLSNRFTTSQEIEYTQKSGAAKDAFLVSEIARQTGFYNKQIELQAGNDVEVQKLVSERNKVLGNLETERFTESAKNLKQIQDLENRQYEERRQAAIEFVNLQIREASFFFDKQTFNLNQGIENQTANAQTGYDELIKITQENYEKIFALNKSQYQKQLEDLSLTEEQKVNLQKQYNLTQLDLSEKNRRDVLELEKKQTAAILQEIQDRTEQQLKIISDAQIGANSFSFFGDIEDISSFNNFDKLLDKAKDLKEFFDSSNRSQATYLKNQSDYYTNLLKISQDSLDRLKRTSAIIISDQLPENNGSAFMPNDAPQPPPIDDRKAKADLNISELEGKIIQYKGISSKFAALATQLNSYAEGVEKSYGTL